MACIDCLHNGICIWTQVDAKHNKGCKHFKNKADFVEVVRCKDCKRRYTHCFERALGDNDFCNRGERRA